ncbi:hypothetical protein ACFVFI_38495, partial [Streptomyces sp. NPDC057705]
MSGPARRPVPLWAKVPPQHVARADERCARGTFRAFAQITAHVIDAVLTNPLECSGSALVEACCGTDRAGASH